MLDDVGIVTPVNNSPHPEFVFLETAGKFCNGYFLRSHRPSHLAHLFVSEGAPTAKFWMEMPVLLRPFIKRKIGSSLKRWGNREESEYAAHAARLKYRSSFSSLSRRGLLWTPCAILRILWMPMPVTFAISGQSPRVLLSDCRTKSRSPS